MLRFCGGLLGNAAAQVTGTTVYTRTLPFQLGVNFDATEEDFTTAELSKGFYIYYNQVAC